MLYFDDIVLCFDDIVLCFDDIMLSFDHTVLCFDNIVLCFDNTGLCFDNSLLCSDNSVLRLEKCLLCLQMWATVIFIQLQPPKLRFMEKIYLFNFNKNIFIQQNIIIQLFSSSQTSINSYLTNLHLPTPLAILKVQQQANIRHGYGILWSNSVFVVSQVSRGISKQNSTQIQP